MKKDKHSFVASILFAPLLMALTGAVIAAGCTTSGGGGGGGTASTAPTGNVEVGFVGTPPEGFQNVLINVSAVRINPQVDTAENDPGWVTIPVPEGVGTGSSGNPGDLQIDLNRVRSQAQLFNSTPVRADTYREVEVLLDVATVGTIVPTCGGGSLEGCISYPLALTADSLILRTKPSNPIQVGANALAPLVINLDFSIAQQPVVSGGFFTVAVAISVAPQQSFLGTVSGTVSGLASQQVGIRQVTVSAEPTGTNTVQVSAPVQNGQFNLALPAALSGTSYDLFVFGGGAEGDAIRGVVVAPGTNPSQNFTTSTATSVGLIGGKIKDACTGDAIQGATVELLLPPQGSSVDCTVSPELCVSVASTSTDNAGEYPMPGTSGLPVPFASVPVDKDFTIKVSASGYDTLLTTGKVSSANASDVCPDSVDPIACSFDLTTAYIVGTVTLSNPPPAGTSVQVQVLAEDSGTNHLQSALESPLVFTGSLTQLDFELNVPTSVSSFDLIATAIDLFTGASDPFPGHDFQVASGVTSGGPGCVVPGAPTVTLGPMSCLGHGSLTGTAVNPDSGTTVRLFKDGVQLMESPVGPVAPAPSPGNSFSFCAPPDGYTLQRFQDGSAAGPTVTPVPAPTPDAISTPCPSVCSNPGGTCPGVCFNAAVASPL